MDDKHANGKALMSLLRGAADGRPGLKRVSIIDEVARTTCGLRLGVDERGRGLVLRPDGSIIHPERDAEAAAEVDASIFRTLRGRLMGGEQSLPAARICGGGMHIMRTVGIDPRAVRNLLRILYAVEMPDGQGRVSIRSGRISLTYRSPTGAIWEDGAVRIRSKALPGTYASMLEGGPLARLVGDPVFADMRIRKICRRAPGDVMLRIVTTDAGKTTFLEGEDPCSTTQ